MYDGKKSVATEIMYGALDLIDKKGGEAKKKLNPKGANATFLLLLQHAFRFQRQKAARSKVSDTN